LRGASKPPIPPKVLRPLASFFSGAVGTIFGSMASTFFAMYLDAGGASQHVVCATVSAMLITLSIARTIGYAAVGDAHGRLADPVRCGASGDGDWLLVGDRIHTGLSQTAFQRVICVALVLCGAPLLFQQ
jgi:uncharacterized membrane protein YfcA